MSLLDKSDEEIIKLADPMWSNLVSNEYLIAKGEVPEFAQTSPERLLTGRSNQLDQTFVGW